MQSPNSDLEANVESQHNRWSHAYDGMDLHSKSMELPPRDKQTDFLFETKYVMLNFMSLVPKELYKGHISASPDSISSDLSNGDTFARRHPYILKSQSFDTNLYGKPPKLKHLSKLKAFQREVESPASEDNLNYRYKQNLQCLENHENFFSNQSDSPLYDATDLTKSPSSQFFQHDFSHSGTPSPQKSQHSIVRMYSDISSSGDFTYFSDADDEHDDFSNASSIFSSRSLYNKDGFLDLRRSLHHNRMPTLHSQSEAELDEADGYLAQDGKTEEREEELSSAFIDNNDNQQVDQSTKAAGNQIDNKDDEWSTSCDELNFTKPRGDRSKLKLNIPCPVLLDDILISLQTELNSELSDLETEYEDVLRSAQDGMASQSPRLTPLTPQSEAARILARIGDEVKEQYGTQISTAVSRLLVHQIREMTYQQFRDISQSVIDVSLPGWRQVALLMVFGQKVVWGAVQHGHKQFGDVIDFCSQLVADVAADFIIKEGGWGAVMNFDPSQSSDNHSSADIDTSPGMVEYFASHDITQVESGLLNPADDTGVCRINTGQAEQTNIDGAAENIQSDIDAINVEDCDPGEDIVFKAVPNTNSTEKLSSSLDNTDLVSTVNNGQNTVLIPVRENEHSSVTRYAPSLGFDFRDQSESGLLCDSGQDTSHYDKVNDPSEDLNCLNPDSLDIKQVTANKDSEHNIILAVSSAIESQQLERQDELAPVLSENKDISESCTSGDQSASTNNDNEVITDVNKLPHGYQTEQQGNTITGNQITYLDSNQIEQREHKTSTMNEISAILPETDQSGEIIEQYTDGKEREEIEANDVSEEEMEQQLIESSHVTDSWDFIGHNRRMGVRIVVITLTLLTVGVAVRMAILNR